MVYNTNNTQPAPVVEEIMIEEQTIEELREQIKVLQEELVEQKRHANKMEELAWEMWEEKKGLQTKLDNLKSKLLGSLFQNKKKSREIKNLKEELEKEKGWLDKWERDESDWNEHFYLKACYRSLLMRISYEYEGSSRSDLRKIVAESAKSFYRYYIDK